MSIQPPLVIVPFGKYKGQSIELLRKDTKYLNWIRSQPSIVRQYQDFFSLLDIKSLPAEPILPTPQHNRIQAQFLSRTFTSKFFHYLTGIDPEGNRNKWNELSDFYQLEFFNKAGLSVDQIDIIDPLTFKLNQRIIVQLIDWFPNLKFEGVKSYADLEFTQPNQIIDGVPKVLLGWSLHITGTYSMDEELLLRNLLQPYLPHNIFIPQVLIEIKPQMGDDYPRVLHLMKQRGHNILYLQQFESSVLPLNQMKEIFNREGILVIMENELIGKIREKNPQMITPPCKVIRKIRMEMEDHFSTVNLYGIPIIIYEQIVKYLTEEQKLSVEITLRRSNQEQHKSGSKSEEKFEKRRRIE